MHTGGRSMRPTWNIGSGSSGREESDVNYPPLAQGVFPLCPFNPAEIKGY